MKKKKLPLTLIYWISFTAAFSGNEEKTICLWGTLMKQIRSDPQQNSH